jgi:hypothetical protein
MAQHMAWSMVAARYRTNGDVWPPQTEGECMVAAKEIAELARVMAEPFSYCITIDESDVDDDES